MVLVTASSLRESQTLESLRLESKTLESKTLESQTLESQTLEPRFGICEACAVNAHWTWRTLTGDAAPTDDTSRVTKVKVVVSRLGKQSAGEINPADHSESYEIVMAPLGSYHDLPTAELHSGEEEEEAAQRALLSVGLTTWPLFLEPLHTAYSPRGSLVRIYLATAYADIERPPGTPAAYQWRKWPPWEHARGLYGLYVGLLEIWTLRIELLRTATPSMEQITTHVRKGAAEYIRMQMLLRQDPDTDVSMATYLRQSMSDDEKIVCKRVMEETDLVAERNAELAPTLEVENEEYSEASATSEADDPDALAESDDDPNATLEAAFEEDDNG